MIRKRLTYIGVLVVASALLRFFMASPQITWPDSLLYLSFAKSILEGKLSFDFTGGINRILPPLYPLSIAALDLFVGKVEISGVLVSSIAGALLIIPVFYLAKTIYNEKSAWVSAVLVFLSPILIHTSGAILTESLFITLFVSGIAMGWYAMKERKGVFFVLTGALFGLSYMTRVIGLVAIPLFSLWVLFCSLRPDNSCNYVKSDKALNYRSGKLWGEAIKLLVLFFLGFFLVTGLYLFYLRSVYGHWTLSASYGSIGGVISTEGAATSLEWENFKMEEASESFIGKQIKKISINGWNYAGSLLRILHFTAIFLIAGLFHRWRILYLISFVLIYFAALLLLPLSPLIDERGRYLSPILPLLLIIASGGIINMREWIKSPGIKTFVIPLALSIVLLSSIPQLTMFPLHFNKFWNRTKDSDARKLAGLWMKEMLPQPIRVMSRKPFIPYYADGIFFTTPSTYEDVIRLADLKDIDYIVVDRDVDFYLRPKLRFLFDPKEVPQDLTFLGGIKHPETGELYIGIYKIKR